MDITDLKVTKYVNQNLQTIIKTLIEYLEDDNGFTSEDFLPSNNLRISDKVWLELVNDLYYAISSDTIRDFMKPKYEYLLYVILEWWSDCTDDVNDLIPVKLDASLIDEINIKYTSENGKNYVLSKITDYEEYYYFIFNDFDFLPNNLEKMLLIYLEFPSFFEMLYQDVDLDEYYELMPKDLQERYDEKRKLAIKDEIINIEQMLHEDVI